jgi:hypothetical protein
VRRPQNHLIHRAHIPEALHAQSSQRPRPQKFKNNALERIPRPDVIPDIEENNTNPSENDLSAATIKANLAIEIRRAYC